MLCKAAIPVNKIWLTSDHHFGHRNIIYYEQRGFDSVKLMNEFMVYSWNKLVQPDDTVIHMGDFALCDKSTARSIFNSLNGTKYIIIGNHDRGPKGLKDIGFDTAEYWMQGVLLNSRKSLLFIHNIADAKDRIYDHIICGHVHSLWKTLGNAINVGVDIFDYKPVRLYDIIPDIKQDDWLSLKMLVKTRNTPKFRIP